MSPVLVTGGSGYLGTQLIAALLRDGTAVRTTVRSLDREAELRKAVRRGGADDAGLEVVTADLMAGEGWPGAVAGDTPKPGADYTEADWTDPDTPGLPPYPRSKAIAERAAWDFIEREGAGTELVSVNPTGIFGPTLVAEVRSTLQLIKALLDGAMTVVPRQRFGVADVRDVADAHIRAMGTPAAAGQRFLVLADGPTISWPRLAQPDLVTHNDRAKRVLGWRPRPAETTITETAESLRDLGLLEQHP